MFRSTLSFVLAAAFLGTPLLLPSAQAARKPKGAATAETSTAATPEQREAEYTQAINKRADDILAALDLHDADKAARVHETLVSQYRALRSWHDANDAKLKELAKAPNVDELKQIEASRQSLHDAFLSRLAADLTPAQVETVKDKMTYNKVKVTYDAYCQIVPNLSEADKAAILSLLKDAREQAIDAGSAEEKSAIFKKYKGRVNIYLDAHGHNVKQAYKDWGAAQKKSATSAGSAPDRPVPSTQSVADRER